MNGLAMELDRLVDELLEVLDADIVRIDLTLQRLDEMRAGVIRRDEQGLNELLEVIRSEQSAHAQLERRRHVVRCGLAGMINCSVEEMNLSRMQRELDPGKASVIAQKQRALKEKVSLLNVEHRATCMLLRDCSRLNGMLLRSLLGNSNQTITYNARGGSSREYQQGMVSVRL